MKVFQLFLPSSSNFLSPSLLMLLLLLHESESTTSSRRLGWTRLDKRRVSSSQSRSEKKNETKLWQKFLIWNFYAKSGNVDYINLIVGESLRECKKTTNGKKSSAVLSRMNFDFFPFLLTSSTNGLLFSVGCWALSLCRSQRRSPNIQKIPPMPLWWRWWRNIKIHFPMIEERCGKKGSWNRTEQGKEEFFYIPWSESTLSGQKQWRWWY